MSMLNGACEGLRAGSGGAVDGMLAGEHGIIGITAEVTVLAGVIWEGERGEERRGENRGITVNSIGNV